MGFVRVRGSCLGEQRQRRLRVHPSPGHSPLSTPELRPLEGSVKGQRSTPLFCAQSWSGVGAAHGRPVQRSLESATSGSRRRR